MKREYEPLTVEQQQYLERQLAEAQGKLDAVQEWIDEIRKRNVGPFQWIADRLDRILKEE